MGFSSMAALIWVSVLINTHVSLQFVVKLQIPRGKRVIPVIELPIQTLNPLTNRCSGKREKQNRTNKNKEEREREREKEKGRGDSYRRDEVGVADRAEPDGSKP
jgi:hypothetical protein